MAEANVELLNGLALAYVGDAIYEVYIRDHLISRGLTKPKRLHQKAMHYVSAKAQAHMMETLLAEGQLNEAESEIYHRGRNAKSHTSAKNADIVTYRVATGFEALMGYLHLTGQTKRLEELIARCIRLVEDENEKQ